MHVLFVYPNIDTQNAVHYPHGIGALAAVLAAAGHEVSVRLIQEMPAEESWKQQLASLEPDLLACGFCSHQWSFARRLMTWAKEVGVAVVAGGVHASFAAGQMIQAGVCDWVCVGEAEGAMLDLASGKPAEQIPNLTGRDFANPPRPLIADLDKLPVYDRRHFPIDEIVKANQYEMTVLVGRGCPYPCTYCCNVAWQALYQGEKWVRWRSPDHLAAELEALLLRYRVDSIYFEDDIFTLNRPFLDKFLPIYRYQYNLPFRVYLRIGTVDRDDLKKLKEAGLAFAHVGIEHGDQQMRENVLARKMTNQQIEQFFDWCRELDIRTRAFHLVGIPGETPATLQATVDLCRKVTPDEVQVSLFEPYPGTPLYDQCGRQGLLTGAERSTYFEPQPSITLADFPPEDLTAAYRDFCRQATKIENQALLRALSVRRKGDIDLVADFDESKVAQQGAEPVCVKRVRIAKAEHFCLFAHPKAEHFCLFAHPRSEVQYTLSPGKYRFIADLALDPCCLAWGGQGARFQVKLDDQVLIERLVDPKNNTEDRGWLPIEQSFVVDKTSTLVLITLPDAGDDLTGLWALWGHPHLLREDRE